MKRLTRRIAQLEQHRPVGCPTCADWTAETLRIAVAGDPAPEIPETCPECGREVPRGIRIVFVQREDGPQ